MNSSNLVSVRRCSAGSSNCRFDFATCGYMPTWPSSNHKNEDNNGGGKEINYRLSVRLIPAIDDSSYRQEERNHALP